MQIKGIQGYAESLDQFVEATLAISFSELHKDFIKFFPTNPAKILDIGSGIGRDAFEFAKMGHSVTAVEPTGEYLETAKRMFAHKNINWIDGSLPKLEHPGIHKNYDLIMASAVFHHLTPLEQQIAVARISEILNTNGTFALSLRNGPAGLGTYLFPTDTEDIIKTAQSCGLKVIFQMDNQPSLLKGKENVVWSKIVFQKQSFYI